MMDCERIEGEDIIEKYLAGKLDPAGREEFEDHYFGCRRCLDKLQAARLVLENYWQRSEDLLAPAAIPARAAIRRRAWAFGAAGAAVLAAAVLLWRLAVPVTPPSGTMPAASSLALLARFDPPPYVPLVLRGAEDPSAMRFRLGMERYAEGRFEEAIPDLRAAAELNPGGAGARFYFGICLLLTDQADEAIATLEAVISLGESAYLEGAHYYLAKAFLAKADTGRAIGELEWVVKRDGRMKEDAVRILEDLR